jgi:homoserine O-acetyltransferase/O-succinyltransferase
MTIRDNVEAVHQLLVRHGVVRLEGQISAITADSAFNGGDYKREPARGLSAFGMVWAGWLYSQE